MKRSQNEYYTLCYDVIAVRFYLLVVSVSVMIFHPSDDYEYVFFYNFCCLLNASIECNSTNSTEEQCMYKLMIGWLSCM